MNFQDGYQSTLGGDSNNHFNSLSESISSNIRKVSQNVSEMQKMVNQIGTASDSESLRKQLSSYQVNTSLLVRETNDYIRELSSLLHPDQRLKRLTRSHLINEFTSVLKNLEVVERTAVQKQQESVSRARANSKLDQSENEDKDFIDFQSPTDTAPQQLIKIEQDLDNQALEKRCEEITKLKNDMKGLNKIFRELEMYALEQGEVVSSIETNVVNAHQRVDYAVEQLSQARQCETKARKKQLICIAVIIIVIVIGALFILYKLNQNEELVGWP